MVKESTDIIQAFPLSTGTNVFGSGVTGFEVHKSLIVHMNADGDITLRDGAGGSVVVNA